MSKLYPVNYDVTFTKDGNIIYEKWEYDEAAGKGEYVKYDKTKNVLSVLHKTVRIEPGFTMKHLFNIVKTANETVELDYFFRDCFIQPFMDYYEQMVSNYTAPVHQYDPDGIECIELYWNAEVDECLEGSYVTGLEMPWMHGLGWELQEDQPEEHWSGYKKGDRITWAMDFSSIDDMLHLPIVLNEQFTLREDFMHSTDRNAKPIFTGRRLYTVGDVIRGIFWEISFHGAPDKVAEKKEELNRAVEEIENGTAKLVPFSEVKDRLSRFLDETDEQ